MWGTVPQFFKGNCPPRALCGGPTVGAHQSGDWTRSDADAQTEGSGLKFCVLWENGKNWSRVKVGLLERGQGGHSSAALSIPLSGEPGHVWGSEYALQRSHQLNFGEGFHGRDRHGIFWKPCPHPVLMHLHVVCTLTLDIPPAVGHGAESFENQLCPQTAVSAEQASTENFILYAQ